jgi:hypothetical protein
MWADLLFVQRERVSKVLLFQITAVTDSDMQRASKAFDWTSQYVEQDGNRLQGKKEQKWKYWQMSNGHCWKTEKEVEARASI